MPVMDVDTHAALVESLDLQVREAVRREGVDPQVEASVVRRLAEVVVGAHHDRSLTGAVAPVADVDSMVGDLVARVSGFGLLQPLLDDPTVEEVWINGPTRVFVARRGRHELTNVILTPGQVEELVERMLKSSGRRIDLSQPFVDAMLPGGHRLHVVLEGISRGWSAVNIRKFILSAARLQELVELGSLSPRAAAFLEASVRAGLNILVAGATQAGKTTLLNCLAAAIPGGERVISAEEVFELRFPHPDWVAMQTRQSGLEGTGEIRLRDLVKESLRRQTSKVFDNVDLVSLVAPPTAAGDSGPRLGCAMYRFSGMPELSIGSKRDRSSRNCRCCGSQCDYLSGPTAAVGKVIMSSQTPAGWFPDPHDESQLRYWDGVKWTEHRAPRNPPPPAGAAAQGAPEAPSAPTNPVAAGGTGTSSPNAPWMPPGGSETPGKKKNWFLRHKILSAVLAFVLILIIAGVASGGSGDSSSPDASSKANSGPTKQPSIKSTPTPTKTATPSPPPVPTYGDGTYRLGKDIKPGTYRSSGDATCYWATLKGFGGSVGDIIDNGNNSPAIVTLTPADKGFQTQGCGSWKNVASTFPSQPATKFGDGAYIVGEDIKPGTYRSTGKGLCYWARRSSFAGGGISGIITNGNNSGIVTISPGDRGFETYGCGDWTH